MIKLGIQAQVYRNTGSYESPAWQPVPACREVTLTLEKADSEATVRGNAGFRTTVTALKNAGVELELAYAPPDDDLDALMAALCAGTTLDLLVADGDGLGAEGLRADWSVLSAERAEPLEDVQRMRLSLKTDSHTHAPQWYTSTGMLGWHHYKEITVIPDNVLAGLYDFPLHVPIEADADIGASARADGLDIRFTNADGTQELAFERERFEIVGGNGEGRFWVHVPEIDPDTGATIRVYYGNPHAKDGQNPAAVWQAYLFVSHLGDLTPSYVRASRGQHARKKAPGRPDETFGHLDSAQDFILGDYLDLGDIEPDCWTVELLYSGYSAPNGILAHWGDLYSSIQLPESGAAIGITLGLDNYATWPTALTDQVNDGNWHHLAFHVPGSGQYDIISALFFLDGDAQMPETTGTDGTQQAKPGNLVLGYLDDEETAMGVYDEVRVYDWSPDTAWAYFAAKNMLNTDNYELTWGPEQ